MTNELEEDILTSLRRIIRAIDLHSRYLANTFGLTGPQLVCLQVVGRHGVLTPSQLAKLVALSQATVTGIVDRLASRQLVTRERSKTDRRHVVVTITEAGRSLLAYAPSALQDRFAKRLSELPKAEQDVIRVTLNKIVAMMEGQNIDASPVLQQGAHSPGDIAPPVGEALPGDAPQSDESGANDT